MAKPHTRTTVFDPTQVRDGSGRFQSVESEETPPRIRDEKGKFVPSVLPARDEKGHSTLLATNVPHALAAIVDQLVTDARAKGEYPWKSRSEVVRWLIAAGLECVDKARDETGAVLAQHRVTESIRRDRQTRIWCENVWSQLTEELDRLVRHDSVEASSKLQFALADIDKMDDTFYVCDLKDKLVARYPALLKRTPIASFSRHSVEDKVPLIRTRRRHEDEEAEREHKEIERRRIERRILDHMEQQERRKPLGSKKR